MKKVHKDSSAAPPLRSTLKVIRRAALVILAVLVTANANAQPALSPSDAAKKGRTFLTNLFDPELSLLPEYRGAKIYWLFHDNYLAAKVLAATHPKVAQTIRAAIDREGVRKSGKIELLYGEAENPLPFRQYELTDVRRFQDKVIRTEVVTSRVLEGWRAYADLLLLACIAEKDESAAKQHWEAAMRLWDGKGFLDDAARHDRRYSTYKLGLALLAAKRLSSSANLPRGMIEKLLSLQEDTGGWITDYDEAGKRVGLANVETTCLAILGIEAFSTHRYSVGMSRQEVRTALADSWLLVSASRPATGWSGKVSPPAGRGAVMFESSHPGTTVERCEVYWVGHTNAPAMYYGKRLNYFYFDHSERLIGFDRWVID